MKIKNKARKGKQIKSLKWFPEEWTSFFVGLGHTTVSSVYGLAVHYPDILGSSLKEKKLVKGDVPDKEVAELIRSVLLSELSEEERTKIETKETKSYPLGLILPKEKTHKPKHR